MASGRVGARRHSGGMTTTAPIRIGDAERAAALDDLATHFATGRLDRAEYDARVDRGLTARFQTDLDLLFTDLPRRAEPTPSTPAPHDSRVRPWTAGIGPFVPMIAVALFLSTGVWLWLLLIPAMGMPLRCRRRVARRRRISRPSIAFEGSGRAHPCG